uniref:Uncharacterized protein n=1 Tax=Mycena chlorophos TaxID=658473 RepID=A0ABQ0LTC5_MYCCL|nr:predicted protein [Mycena chlorophos]
MQGPNSRRPHHAKPTKHRRSRDFRDAQRTARPTPAVSDGDENASGPNRHSRKTWKLFARPKHGRPSMLVRQYNTISRHHTSACPPRFRPVLSSTLTRAEPTSPHVQPTSHGEH